jgi:hypothetical protein
VQPEAIDRAPTVACRFDQSWLYLPNHERPFKQFTAGLKECCMLRIDQIDLQSVWATWWKSR